MKRTTGLDIEAIKKRHAATPSGDWAVQGSVFVYRSAHSGDGRQMCRIPVPARPDHRPHPIAEFIAHAHQDVPALVQEVERLRSACRAVLALNDWRLYHVNGWDHAFDQVRAALEGP